MTRGVMVPLDSYRLANYSVGLPCYICGEDNLHDAEICRHCFAPLALAHQVNAQGIQPQILTTIGSSGAGKTVFLGMLLDMLSRQPNGLQLLARGAFSITLQQLTISALAQCRFPQKTPLEADRWNWVHAQLKSTDQPQPLELVMPDLAGEAIAQEIEHPFSQRAIRELLTKSRAALLLVDAMSLERGLVEQDFFLLKLLCYLQELPAEAPPMVRRGTTLPWSHEPWGKRPLAVVFTKADVCDGCFDDPEGFAAQYLPGVRQFCRDRFSQVAYFAAGVAGGCVSRTIRYEGRVRVPLRIEPRGIVEPFEWLIQQLQCGKKRNAFREKLRFS